MLVLAFSELLHPFFYDFKHMIDSNTILGFIQITSV